MAVLRVPSARASVSTVTTQDIHPGTTWENRKSQVRVMVVRTTEAGKVVCRKRDGKNWTLPLDVFVSTFLTTGELHHICTRCGVPDLRLEDKYCKSCQAALARFRNAQKTAQEASVLTTNSRPLIEQKHEDAMRPPTPLPVGKPVVVDKPATDTARAYRWRITGRVTMELYVEGANVIDALSSAEQQYQGMEVTDVHLLD